jgi:MraZ protein
MKWEKVVYRKTMLIGEYTHSIDDKNRISLPAKFRKEVGKKVVLTHGLDNCLFLYTFSEWEKISEKLASLSMGQSNTRGFNRFMLAGAMEVDIDSVGRMLIPEHLKKFAGIEEKVVFTGVHNRIELWQESRWIEYKKRIEAEADTLAEKLGEIGAF